MPEAAELRESLVAYFGRIYGVSREQCEKGFPLAHYVDSLGLLMLLEYVRKAHSVQIDPARISAATFGTFHSMLSFIVQEAEAGTR